MKNGVCTEVGVGVEIVVGTGLVAADLVGIAHEGVVVEVGALGDGLVDRLILFFVFVLELDLPRLVAGGGGHVVVDVVVLKIHG